MHKNGNYEYVNMQHSVGHGGFHTGRLSIWDEDERKNLFRWVYDCGANKQKLINREILAFGKEDIDLIFISHFDRDHCNGLKEIIDQKIKFSQIVIPYIDNYEKLYLISALDKNELDLMGEIILSPYEFFKDNFIDSSGNLIFIYPDSEAVFPSSETPILFELTINKEDKDISIKWNGKYNENQDARLEDVGIPKRHALLLNNGCKILVNSVKSSQELLTFIPYVRKVDHEIIGEFKKELKIEFGTDNAREIINNLTNEKIKPSSNCFGKLKQIYNKITTNHNNTSMSLYTSSDNFTSYKLQLGGHNTYKHCIIIQNIFYRPNSGDWLMTGDTDLKNKNSTREFVNFYSSILKNLRYFALPHHGSEKNISVDFLKHLRLDTLVFSSGVNNHVHPSDTVVSMLKSYGFNFHNIDERVNTAIFSVGLLKTGTGY